MEVLGGTLRSRIAKVSAGLFSVGLLGGSAFCIAKSVSIESVTPAEMFRRIRSSASSNVREKLIEQFPFLTVAEIDICRGESTATGGGGKEFTFSNALCEKAFQTKVINYCMEQEVLKSRYMSIGVVLFIIAAIIIGTIIASSSSTEETVDDAEKVNPPSSAMTVVLIGLFSFGLLGLSGFLLFNRIKTEPFKSEIVRKIYADFRPSGSNREVLLFDERIDHHFQSDPSSRNNIFPGGKTFYENVRRCGRLAVTDTGAPTSLTSPGEISSAADETVSLESCRALEFGTYDEIVEDSKNKEMFVIWGFISFLASYIIGSIAYSKYKTL